MTYENLTNAQQVMLWIAIAAIAVTVLLAAIRVVLGPTLLDRVVASDAIMTTIVLALAVDMVINEHSGNIPVMVAIVASAAFATVTVARHVRKKEEPEEDRGA